jgi:hypothetical protein
VPLSKLMSMWRVGSFALGPPTCPAVIIHEGEIRIHVPIPVGPCHKPRNWYIWIERRVAGRFGGSASEHRARCKQRNNDQQK